MLVEKNLMYQSIGFDSSERIVIGSEICPIHFLKKENWTMITEAVKKNKKIRLVTPIIPQKYIDEVFSMICNIPGTPKITFNDYGLLYKCEKLIFQNRIEPVLGRIVTHSLIDCPWYKDIIKHEAEYYDVMENNNMVFASKIEFAQKWGIKEFEVNNCPPDSLDYFHNNQILVTQYANYNILSVSRTCFHAKNVKSSPQNCYANNSCTSKFYRIKMKDLYSNKFKMLIPVNDSIINWNDIQVFGTTLFIKNKSINKDIDYLIM